MDLVQIVRKWKLDKNFLMNHRSSQSVRYTQVGWVCLAIGLFLQIVSGNLVNRSPNLLNHHRITKRSFYDLQCKGVYDKSIFARLDRICEDCYNLFREPSIYSLCRDSCFSDKYFKGCVESLLMDEDWPQLEKMVEYVGK
ncbi:CHH-like protein isoform X2 [Diabrotica undecimpunctata]|uniref:CHH-like protein isoform X2 n=1 Tax=Diabrotica undecimpunctata TaxID=50387 RepID=UPI003B633E25